MTVHPAPSEGTGVPQPPAAWVARTVARALDEDLGRGDATTRCVVPAELEGCGRIRTGQDLVLAGGFVVREVFRQLDPGLEVNLLQAEGVRLRAGVEVARVTGRCAPILAGERTALNFLQRLCGIATLTSRAVAAAGVHTVIMDTRKTTPGLRPLERYAVRAGGASNHRGGLDDGILIKDNHVACCGGSPAEAVRRARAAGPPLLRLAVEIDRLEDLEDVLAAGADVVLLDNFPPALVAAAVEQAAGRTILEASGGITVDLLPAYAATGVARISLGLLTHSAPAADLELELQPVRAAHAP